MLHDYLQNSTSVSHPSPPHSLLVSGHIISPCHVPVFLVSCHLHLSASGHYLRFPPPLSRSLTPPPHRVCPSHPGSSFPPCQVTPLLRGSPLPSPPSSLSTPRSRRAASWTRLGSADGRPPLAQPLIVGPARRQKTPSRFYDPLETGRPARPANCESLKAGDERSLV